MFEAWLFVLANRARLPDTVNFVLYDLFSIFAYICTQRSASFGYLCTNKRTSAIFVSHLDWLSADYINSGQKIKKKTIYHKKCSAVCSLQSAFSPYRLQMHLRAMPITYLCFISGVLQLSRQTKICDFTHHAFGNQNIARSQILKHKVNNKQHGY